MTDELDVLSRLVDYHDHIAPPTVSVADDVRRGRRRVARRRTLAAGGVALAVAGVVVTVSLVTRSDPGNLPPEPAPSPSEKHTAIDPVLRNGQVTSAERYLRGEGRGYEWRAFDPVSDTGLFATHRGDHIYGPLEGLAVVGRDGRVATLTCARDLPCSPGDTSLSYVATLGPGADEVTVASGGRTVQVIGYDGTSSRTLQLAATIPDDEKVRGLRWSPDGDRLAVLTAQVVGQDGEEASRVWLVDREGGDARLAYSLSSVADPTGRADASDFDGQGLVWAPGWGWSWSPDGRALLLDVRTGGSYGSDVVVLHLQPDGAADPVIAETLYHSTRHFDWWGNLAWSPDGARIAVRSEGITEISAEDGSVLAQHPRDDGWLIWPARGGSS